MQKKYEIKARVKVENWKEIPPEMLGYWLDGYELLYRNGSMYAIKVNELNQKV